MENREDKSRLDDLITMAKDRGDNSRPQEILPQTFGRRNQFRKVHRKVDKCHGDDHEDGLEWDGRVLFRYGDNDFRRGPLFLRFCVA